MFLAGSESWVDTLLEMGVRNQLVSYFYLRHKMQRPKGRIEAMHFLAKVRNAQKQGYRFMLDSGAFTYRINAAAALKNKALAHKDLPPIDVYFREYKDFLLEHGDIFDAFVELDVEGTARKSDGKLLTIDEADDWSYELMDIPEIGWRTMQIYHASRSVTWLRRALSNVRSPYLGVGSGMANWGAIAATVATAREWGKFTHGFAMTKIKTDMKYLRDFGSVDSTSWLRADKFGGTTIFDNNRFIVFDSNHKHWRRNWRHWYEKWGLDVDKILKDDLSENRKATIVAWREQASAFERYWLATNGKYPDLFLRAVRGDPQYTEHPRLVEEKRRRAERA